MDHDSLYFLFHRISRFLLLIPFIVVVVGLIARYEVKKEVKKSVVMIQPTATIVEQKQRFNLQGPLRCLYSSQNKGINYQVKAYVKNKQVSVEYKGDKTTTNHYLFVSDCLYVWEQGKGGGTQTCGLNQYVSLFEKLISMPFFDPMTVLAQSDQIKNKLPIPIDSEAINNIVKSCKQEDFNEQGIFDIPKMPWLRPTFPSR